MQHQIHKPRRRGARATRIRSSTTKSFRTQLQSLPPHIQKKAHDAFHLFKRNPKDPRLRLHRVYNARLADERNTTVYAAEVSLRHRALAFRMENHYVWYFIGTHETYNSLLKG